MRGSRFLRPVIWTLGGLAGAGYGAAIEVRNAMFDLELRRPRRLPRPVISVGNITVGGTGKTPMVIAIARRLQAMGAHPAVLLRGYKTGHGGRSDEAAELRESLGPQVPVEADPDRIAAALRVLDSTPQVDAFVLDDGFQRRQVQRDLNLVLIDATNPFGDGWGSLGGRLLPLGRLREPARNLSRADGVMITRADQVLPEALEAVDRRVTDLTGRRPLAHAAHRWSGLIDADDQPRPLTALRDAAVLGVCGVGNWRAFLHLLDEHTGRNALGKGRGLAFADHHDYTSADVARIAATAREHAAVVVTTAKDWVKLRRFRGQFGDVKVSRPVLTIEFLDGEQALTERLAGAWRRGAVHHT